MCRFRCRTCSLNKQVNLKITVFMSNMSYFLRMMQCHVNLIDFGVFQLVAVVLNQ
jgi:hypothetical protein